MNTLETYVKRNFKTESSRSIGEKFGVKYQTISHVLINLKKRGEIDINESFNQQNKLRLNTKRYEKKKQKLSEPKKVKFKNFDGVGKKECRKIVSEMIGSVPSRFPKILTLPSSNWLWEKEILKQKSTSRFIGVEHDKKTFNLMVKKYTENEDLLNSVIGLYNRPIGEIIEKSNTNDFDHMILDYCGMINTYKLEIEDVVQRDLVKVGGIISVTLSVTNRHNNRGKEVELISNTIPTNYFGHKFDITLSTKVMMLNIILNQKGKYKIVETVTYEDTSPMMLFVIRRLS
jgi:hypothetical protein